MHHALIAGALIGLVGVGGASAHAIFPGSAKVQTFGERALVQFHAVNARKDISMFKVEIFNADDWSPARNAVAWPQMLNVPAQDLNSDAVEAVDHPFSVMIDLAGKREQRLRVCTKSVPQRDMLKARQTIVNTRVCATVLVQRFQR